jgi:hypothetical protein
VNEATITEEKRLSYLVEAVDRSCSVIPRGSYVLTPEHKVIPNTMFQGMLL